MADFDEIVVVGSCMMDFTSYAPRLPKSGETIHGTKFSTSFGGKGANQCVAAAKLGGKTAFVGRVGSDIFGKQYLENLTTQNVNTKYVWTTPGYTNGIAQIIVSEEGENQIVIVAGANSQLNYKDIEAAKDLVSRAKVLVCQLETSPEVARSAIKMATGISILNGAPAISDLDQDLLKLPTIFCVNETEASVFTGLQVNNKEEAIVALKALLNKGCQSVIMTLGKDGAMYASQKEPIPVHVGCKKVKCLDSTGAGDAFIGALAYLLATNQDLPMKTIMEAACFVASDTVTRFGTQTSFPGSDVLKKYFNQS